MAAEVDPKLYEHSDDSSTEDENAAVQINNKCTDKSTTARGKQPTAPRSRLVRGDAGKRLELPEEIPDSQESLDLSEIGDQSLGNSFHTEDTVIIEGGTQITAKPTPKYRLHQRGLFCNGRLPIEAPEFAHHIDMEEEATQPATQPFFDPRRMGRNNSGLTAEDESDVICILHPTSTAALRAVALVAKTSPQHILQNEGLEVNMEEDVNDDEQKLNFDDDGATRDIALRMSSRVKDPCLGFCFGRHALKCDFILNDLNDQKRVSNTHFRIYVNKDGILMLHDMSTNGTYVDEVLLMGKSLDPTMDKRRMLAPGSIIQLVTRHEEEKFKFVVRIPARDGDRGGYARKLSAYLAAVAQAESDASTLPKAKDDISALPGAVVPHRQEPRDALNYTSTALLTSATVQHHHGMAWNGGEEYNIVGYIGKGAFAMVFKAATKRNGEVVAVKQIEKRKFIKDGVLDHKINNELEIIRHLRHPNIVQYIHYFDHESYLYIFMEYIPCGELSSYMSQNGPMPELLAKSVSRQMLNALDYLHKRKITHRDVKPDNMLIASNDPFTVKLSDFGLSKVVNDTETFLKTFCGTLLYCAPEVYPDYDLYKSSSPVKRRRRGKDPPPRTLPYNQSIDTWSFAAVLFHLISGKPPYAGSNEGKGARMLANIMTTPLDVSPLKDCGVSRNGIDLITKMLNPNPLLRPDERQCMSHAWLADCASFYEIDLDDNNLGIGANEGEDDARLGKSFDPGSENSQDHVDDDLSEMVEADEIEQENIRRSKRARVDTAFVLRDQVKLPSSSPEVLYPSLPPVSSRQSKVSQTGVSPQNARLFGEIGASALRSSGVFRFDNRATLPFTTQGSSDPRTSTSSSDTHHFRNSTNTDQVHTTHDDLGQYRLQYPQTLPHPHLHPHAGPASSLMGAEALVGRLNMGSPESAKSAPSAPNTPATPTTPKTREATPTSAAAGSKRSSQDISSGGDQTEPKRRRGSAEFWRKNMALSLDPPPSIYFLPTDKRTHCLQYASQVSGRDYVAEAKAALAAMRAERDGDESVEPIALLPGNIRPWTMIPGWEKEPYVVREFGGELDPSRTDTLSMDCRAYLKAKESAKAGASTLTTKPAEFIKPPPRLGKLTSVPGSFADVTLKLEQRLTSWGRAPENTIVYPQNFDMRIPKQAMDIMWWGPSMPSFIDKGGDWMEVENSWAIIVSRASTFILVNGVKLRYLNRKGNAALFGRLYTGDVVTVFEDGKEYLRFKCEFFHGRSAGPRPKDEQPFFIEKETERFLLVNYRSTSKPPSAAAPGASASAASASASVAPASSISKKA